ncbi:hypothetical protein T484DRAFT_1762107 [Baffinella frigidus]|nr:hypothetical protein T484DRAFT_1762107 [Cryptophyta sp. CCMP2293]
MEQQQFGPPKGVDPNKLPHLSIVICGHVDSGIPPLPHLSVLTIWMSDSMVLRPAGKSTVTGRLLYELGMFSAHDLDKLRAEATTLGKSSFAFAFFMDRQKEERARGLTIACTTSEFCTKNFHYTIIDAPVNPNP